MPKEEARYELRSLIGGKVTAIPPTDIPENACTDCSNVWFKNGEIRKRPDTSSFTSTTFDSTVMGFYEYRRLSGYELGDNNNQLSGYENITGVSDSNSDADHRLHFSIVDVGGGTYRVDIYQDSARTAQVGHTANYTGTGVSSITEDNSSGLGGTITVDSVVGADTDISAGFPYFSTASKTILIAVTLTSFYQYDSVNDEWDVVTSSCFTGTTSDFFSFVTYAGTLVLTNGVDHVKKWTGIGNVVDLGGGGTYQTITESGDNNNQLSGYSSITGVNVFNTDANYRLYFSVVDVGGGTYRVDLYKDVARTSQVGHTANYTAASSVAITEDNSSGLGGTLTIDSVVGADTDIYAEIPYYHIARHVAQFKERVFLFHTTEDSIVCPLRMRYSDVGSTWEDGWNQFFDLQDKTDDIVSSLRLSQKVVIYKTDSILLCFYIGGTQVFSFATAVETTGLFAPRTLRAVSSNRGDAHIFLASDGVKLYDGSSYVTDISEPIRDDIIADSELPYANKAFAVTINRENLYLLFMPDSSGNINKCYVYNYILNCWTVWSFPNDDFSGAHEYGGEGSNWLPTASRSGLLGNGTASEQLALGDTTAWDSEAFWDSKDIVLNEYGDDYYVTLKRIIVDVTGGSSNSLIVKLSTDEGSSWTTLGTATLSTSWSREKIDVPVTTTAKRFRLRFIQDSGASAWFQLRKASIFYDATRSAK